MVSKMANYVYGGLSKTTNCGTAKQILDALQDMVLDLERIAAPELLKKVVSMRYDGQGSVRHHLIEFEGLVRRLKALDVDLPEYLVNQLALDSLPSRFDAVRLAYITQEKQEKWRLTDIASRCANLEKFYLQDKVGESGNSETGRSAEGNQLRKRGKCFSCGKYGHLARNCIQVENILIIMPLNSS